MNYREVAFDSNGQAIMWQDVSGRLYTYSGNDFVECNEQGIPLTQVNQDLRPIAVDNYGNPIRWEDRAGRTYVLDNNNNLVEEPVTNVARNTTAYSTPTTNSYRKPAGTTGTTYVSDRFKNVEVKSNVVPKQPKQPVRHQQDTKPVSLLTYKITGKYKYLPLVDETMYEVRLKIDKQNRTFSYVVTGKDV